MNRRAMLYGGAAIAASCAGLGAAWWKNQPHDIAPRPGLAPDGWPLTHAELEAQIPELERIFGLPGGSYGADFLTAEQ